MSVQGDLVQSFRWVYGHADVWRWFADGELFRRIVGELAGPFRDVGVTKVVALEARGFLLAGAIATELGAGVVVVRKKGRASPGSAGGGSDFTRLPGPEAFLVLQSDHLTDVDRVLLVDDWIETGSQALAARTLIDGTGAEFAGLAVIVRDGTTREVQERLQPIHFLIDVEAFGPSDALPSEL